MCDWLCRLFTKEKQLKKLFTDLLTKEKSGEVVFDETKLRSHGTIVMDTLGAAVECLDDSSQLTILLVEIGERHAHYGVRSDMIPVRNQLFILFTFFFLNDPTRTPVIYELTRTKSCCEAATKECAAKTNLSGE